MTLIYREALDTVARSGPKADVHIGTQGHRDEPARRARGGPAELASRTPDTAERLVLVDEANAVRPWSLW